MVTTSNYIATNFKYLNSIFLLKASKVERNLIDALLKDYNRLERPVVDYNSALNVSVGLQIIQIADYVSSVLRSFKNI